MNTFLQIQNETELYVLDFKLFTSLKCMWVHYLTDYFCFVDLRYFVLNID